MKRKSDIEEKVIEVKTETVADRRIWFKNTTNKSHHLRRRIVKPNEKFLEFPENVPTAFRDIIRPLDGQVVTKGTEETPLTVKAAPALFTKQPRGKSKSLFDIVDAQGKVLNEKALSKEDADKLLEDLSK